MVKLLLAALALLLPMCNGLAGTDTITWGGDNSRAGYQTNHNMDPSVINSADFAQIFKTALPGNYNGNAEQIFSQPLVYTPASGTKQYVYFATTQNNVYKLDAATGVIVASRNLAIPFLTADLNGCVDINPLIGISSTGVIDPDTETIYYTVKTYANQAGGNGAQGKPNGRYYLHAISVDDLAERPNFPVNLEGIAARNNPSRWFNGGIHHQRPALLHSGQFIYAGFASHCVQYNFTGWLMGFDKTTGAVVERYAMEGAGVPNTTPGGGIWMSGGGLASDDQGSLFFATGNGYASQLSTVPVEGRNPPTSLEEAAVHMSLNSDGSVTIVDFFMPQEKQALDGADKDLGTSPLEILPSQFSCGSITRMGVITGKSGKTYWLNLDDLGGYRTGANSGDNVIQVYQNENSVYAGAGVYPLEGGYIYINVIQYPTHIFKFSCNNGVPSFTKVADTAETNAYTLGVSHGTVTSLNGQEGTGLLWTTDVQGSNLRIYDAVPTGGTLTLLRSFSVPGTTKFTRAVFGDGRMYMGTTLGYVYGFGGPTTNPLNCSSPIDFGSVDILDSSITTTITCKAVTATTVNSLTLSDPDFNVSTTTVFPKALAVGATFSFSATFKPTAVGLLTGSVSIATTNGATGFTSKTPVLLEGTGTSSGALLAISASVLTFNDVVIGQNDTGSSQPTVFSNQGNATLDITAILFSESASGPWTAGTNTSTGYANGAFLLSGVPAVIGPNAGKSVTVNFNPTTGGNYTMFTKVVSTGGNQTFEVTANAGPASTCLVEFQTPDATGWVTYQTNVNFTFGSVTENTARYLKMRITNNGTSDAVPLSITVSKPPFGVAGIVQANNNVDLAEGTILKAGESATATLYCAVPKEQWNTDTYYGQANWTLNTNDPLFDKQFIQFSCQAVSEQAPPLQANGQGTYRYVGCFKENNPGRQLTNQLYSNVNNTAAKCIAACAAGGYTYCGTQYNVECWGGNTIPVLQVSESDCNYPCSGDINQICGGNGAGADAGGSFISLFATSGASTGGGSTGGNTGGGTGTSTSGPVVNPGVYGYNSIGCYHEPTTGRALSAQLTANQTVAACIAAAAAKSYAYAGIEYGGECWAGNTLNPDATAQTLSTCSMPCNGNTSEYCGGPVLLNMYALNGTATLPTTSTGTGGTTATTTAPVVTGGPYVNPGTNGYSFVGCYKEPATSRAFTNQLSVTSQTVANCIAAAKAAGYNYAGVEYGGECWAGQSINAASSQAATTACSMTCNGNTTEYCGGSLLLDVYQFNSSSTGSGTNVNPVTTTGTTTAVSTPTIVGGPYINPGVSGYNFVGCYNEPSTGRAFSNQLSVTSQTVANCIAAAKVAGYSFAAVEYGGECWAGNSINAASSKAATSACTMTCNGNTTEYCGGSLLLDVYQFNSTSTNTTTTTGTGTGTATGTATTTAVSTPTIVGGPYVNPGVIGYSFIGCYNEPGSARAFTNQLSVTSQTVANCINAAKVAGYSFAGVEYGGECWAGNAINSLSTKAAASACSMTCNGNTTEYCGGSLLLDVYQSNASAVATTATTATTKTGTTATGTILTGTTTAITTAGTTTSATTTTAAVVTVHTTKPTVAAVWSYLGCYTEGTSERALFGISQTNNDMTYEICAAYCSAYAYFGVEYGDQCYCGNSFAAGAAPTAESQCSTYCAGDASEICGNGNRLNVYQQAGKQIGLPSAKAQVGNYGYLGCYSEGTNVRALSGASTTIANMTQEYCASYCAANGNTTMFGVEYGTQCYCGNVFGVGSTNHTAATCTMACGGNAFELCGGGNLLNVWTYNGAGASTTATTATTAGTTATTATTNTTTTARTTTTTTATTNTTATTATTATTKTTTSPTSTGTTTSTTSTSTKPTITSTTSTSTSTSTTSTSTKLTTTSTSTTSTSTSTKPTTTSATSTTSTSTKPTTTSTTSTSTTSTNTTATTTSTSTSTKPTTPSTTSTTSTTSTSTKPTTPSTTSTSTKPTTTSTTSTSTKATTTSTTSTTNATTTSTTSTSTEPTTTSTTSTTSTSTKPTTTSTTSTSTKPTTTSTTTTNAGQGANVAATTAATTTSTKATSTSTTATTATPSVYYNVGNKNFTLVNCYQEPSSGTLLSTPVETNTTKMTVGKCLTSCLKYQYAGLESGSQCWCGNDLSKTSTVLLETQCNTICPGNTTEYCGSTSKMLVYNSTLLL